MRFIDECELRVEAGAGGKGAVAFRREKFVPFGGPAGGDGGRGGDVILVADSGVNTLYELTHLSAVRAAHGGPGQGKDCYGRGGEDSELRVPVGTVVYDVETREKVRELRLELRVMADVGLLGFPNVGKSTLISAVSRARPKVADYPFTTLVPHLGVVTIGDFRQGLGRSFVIADIPGLIPGASEGAGLGIQFLRHLDRTRLLLHLITVSGEEGRSPLADYHAIRKELKAYSPELARRPEVVALAKADLPDVHELYDELKVEFEKLGVDLLLVSAATHQGLDEVIQYLAERLFL